MKNSPVTTVVTEGHKVGGHEILTREQTRLKRQHLYWPAGKLISPKKSEFWHFKAALINTLYICVICHIRSEL